MIQSDTRQQTFWERMAKSRWGEYLSDVERGVLREALARFETPGEAVEIGCEGGRWSRTLADAGWSTTCTDIDPDALAACQQGIPSARCLLAAPDDSSFPIEDDSADLLLSIEVPISEEPWFADEVARVLRPGGIAVCTFHNSRSFRAGLVNLRSLLGGGERHYHASYTTCRRRLTDAGLSLCRETGFAWFPFSRGSDSQLVPWCARLEHRIGLRTIIRYSPWVAVIVKKPATTEASLLANRGHADRIRC